MLETIPLCTPVQSDRAKITSIKVVKPVHYFVGNTYNNKFTRNFLSIKKKTLLVYNKIYFTKSINCLVFFKKTNPCRK